MEGNPPTPTLLCACRRPAALFMANTLANRLREFYRCANPARQSIRCSYFKDTQVNFSEDFVFLFTGIMSMVSIRSSKS